MIDERCAGVRVDHGRAAVYAAEEAAFGGAALDDVVALDVVRERGRSIVDGEWWRACHGPAVEIVGTRASARSSSARPAAQGSLVRIAPGQRTVATVAHELAHAMVGPGRGHDAVFRAAHVDIVAVLDGAGSAGALRVAYERFDLPIADRTWPPPMRGRGPDFVMLP